MKNDNAHALLSSILELLKMMTEAGAEIYRIEDSANHIFNAYGFKNVDIYATTSNIIISVETEDGAIKTHSRRISGIATNIEAVDKLNSLVRHITEQTPDAQTIKAEIDKIKALPNYPFYVRILFYGIIAGAFYFFFGGRNLAEFAVSSGIGLMTGVITALLDRAKTNKFMVKFVCSLAACLVIFSLKSLSVVTHLDNIIIANIMTLIPGVGLTNSLRDLFVGDSVSGILRLIEVTLLALAIACGYILTTLIFGGVAL